MFHPRNAVDTPPLTFAAAYGCMTRVGITPPKVTVTADDKRLKAGKPAPDPFLLAAQELGCDTARVSSSTTRRPASSHERSQIEDCGAHFVVDTIEQLSNFAGFMDLSGREVPRLFLYFDATGYVHEPVPVGKRSHDFLMPPRHVPMETLSVHRR
ncbi:hypothetical protein BD311DRAFT_809230 [Dichomitus squalens]|uniref:Uncharacterized protein n=1 Tax=Dichomitus squalens TaxID=114155 RepID=A0A4Q9MDH2_9APHY|nr:hypothetical protein BD311DRAFT_809230 [Dichomitus squalens]